MRTAERAACFAPRQVKHCHTQSYLLSDGVDADHAARWSPDRKWDTVSVDPSGTVATRTDDDGDEEFYGYIQTTEAVSEGVHTW